MNNTQKIALSLGLGMTALVPIAATAFAATDSTTTPATNGSQSLVHGRGGMRGGKGGMHPGQPLQNFSDRIAKVNFSAAGVTQPTWWGDLTTWVKSDDAKKVAAWLLTQRPLKDADKPTTPPGPGAMLEKIDFTAAGVTKPAFWDNLLAWVKSDDAKKVFEAQMAARGGERFTKLAEELSTADFAAAGITKPAFWGDLMTWLKSPDASKLALQLIKAHGPKQGNATTSQN